MTEPPSTIEQRLKSIEEERLATHALRIKTRLKEGELLKDLISRFTNDFNRKKQSILRELERMRDLDEEVLPEKFEALVPLVKDLTTLLNEAVIFLPAFEIRVAREGIDRMEETIANTRAQLLPRKKFKFSQKAINVLKGKSDDRNVVEKESHVVIEDTAGTDLALSVVDLVNDIIYRAPNSLPLGADFAMARLTSCSISICTPLTALRMHQLKDCTVYCGPITGSVHAEECTNCVLVMASQQIRSGPIIEHCSGLRFAPYVLEYPELSTQLKESKLDFDKSQSKWANVQDFRWLRIQQSPNWSVLPEEERIRAVVPIISEKDRDQDEKTRNSIKKSSPVSITEKAPISIQKIVSSPKEEKTEQDMDSDDEM